MTALSHPPSQSPWLRLPTWLDRLIFWIPNSRRPGVLAFGLFLVRVTVLPMLLAFAVLAPFAATPPAHPLAGISVMLGFSVLIEECGRYSFARTALEPARALALFTVMIIGVETATYWRPQASVLVNLALHAPSMAVHVLAGGALLYALRHRAHLGSIMSAVFVLHLVFDVGSVALFGNQLAASKTYTGVGPTSANQVGPYLDRYDLSRRVGG